ncbi:polyprenyl synthetase family protein [Desemzia sp. RIT804]|uniref:polyprenyl synthetase family protein n=1 Tax=Desemzia sp. RIT 804 TaxID=2810209 RepID=UPI001950FE2B|nr:polyprenyl synthetase family protein [Desemzia sp. RIT 804]MBM6615199.1 polyprenyl synthetase family protein [Desemzia sp. RIT 804]
MKIHPMWEDYPMIQSELKACISLLEKNITIKNEDVQQKIIEMLSSGGKMLRPAFSLMFSQYKNEKNEEKAHAIAAAVELLHVATLIHDDVIDESDLRRGQETINAQYDNRVAVYTGDYLFTVCFRLLTDYAEDAAALQLDKNGMEMILVGELNQMKMKYNFNMTMRNYLSQIQGKTAQLFALSCYSGAYEKNAEKLARSAYQIGNNIGMAFQIIDDILDYTQDTAVAGKPMMSDLKNGVYTAPLLYAMRENRQAFEPYILKKEQITEEEVKEVYALVQQYKGEERAKELANKYTQKALKQIRRLPEHPVKHSLLTITEQMLSRDM